MKGIIVVLSLSIILVMRPSVEAKTAGKTGATFLKIGVGAKPISMGEAFCAIADDPSAIYYNPAGLAHFNNRELSFTHISWFQKINYEYLTYVNPIQELGVKIPGVLAGNLAYLGIDDIKEYGASKDSYLGTFKAYDLLFNLAYARLIKPALSSGLNLKFVTQRIKSSSSALAMDFGLLYKAPIKNLTGGITVQNIALLNNFKDDLPLNIKLGSSYNLLQDNILTLAMDMDIPSDADMKLHLGAEYIYPEIEEIKIAIRLGYKTGVDSGNLGFGFGLVYERYKLDYAYSSYNDLGNVHQLSLHIKFDKPKPQPITSAPKIKETIPVLSHSIPSDSKPNVVFESEGENVSEVIEFDETNKEVKPESPKIPNNSERQIAQPKQVEQIEDKKDEIIDEHSSEETSISLWNTKNDENVMARSKLTGQSNELASSLVHNESNQKELFSEEKEIEEETSSSIDEEESNLEDDNNYSKAKVTIWR